MPPKAASNSWRRRLRTSMQTESRKQGVPH
jgi:hypothetical protein